DVKRPLAELTLILDGRTLLVRRGNELVEPGGQLRIDFDNLAFDKLDRDGEEEERAIIPSPAIFLSRDMSQVPEEAALQRLAAWAAELDEAGDLRSAAEMYRAALAAGGPQPELWCELAEVPSRAD